MDKEFEKVQNFTTKTPVQDRTNGSFIGFEEDVAAYGEAEAICVDLGLGIWSSDLSSFQHNSL